MPAKPTKTTTRKPATKRTTRTKKVAVPHEHIETRAYFIHLEEGGDAADNWLRAERELVPA
jgi:Protein of unknown function (DUF2934)